MQAEWRDRDGAILAADAAGYTTAAIGHSFGLSRTSVIRIVSGGGLWLDGAGRRRLPIGVRMSDRPAGLTPPLQALGESLAALAAQVAAYATRSR